MNRKFLDKDFYELFIMDMDCFRDKDNVVLIPGFDQAISAGEIDDTGRILRIIPDFDPEKTQEIAIKFAALVSCLAEIGQWYHFTGLEFGSKPDEADLHEPGAMDVWDKYISGYKGFDSYDERITGNAPDLLAFMCYRYCKYEAIGAPEVILLNAARELSYAYIINGYARKAERIDMLMDQRETRSYFPERDDLTIDDFRKMARFLDDMENVKTNKSRIFYNKTRTDKAIEKLYKELLEMDND